MDILIQDSVKKELDFANGYAVFSKEEYDKTSVVYNRLGKNKAKYRYFYKENLESRNCKNLLFILFNPSKSTSFVFKPPAFYNINRPI